VQLPATWQCQVFWLATLLVYYHFCTWLQWPQVLVALPGPVGPAVCCDCAVGISVSASCYSCLLFFRPCCCDNPSLFCKQTQITGWSGNTPAKTSSQRSVEFGSSMLHAWCLNLNISFFVQAGLLWLCILQRSRQHPHPSLLTACPIAAQGTSIKHSLSHQRSG
jgi:hypothetical protein